MKMANEKTAARYRQSTDSFMSNIKHIDLTTIKNARIKAQATLDRVGVQCPVYRQAVCDRLQALDSVIASHVQNVQNTEENTNV